MDVLTKSYIKDWTSDSEWIFNTPSQFAKSNLLYAQEVGFFKASKKYFTQHQGISSYLIMLTLDGIGEYTTKDKTYRLEKNSLVFADSMEFHTHRTAPDSPVNWEILWVQFNGFAASGYFGQFATIETPVINIGDNAKIPILLKYLLKTCKTKSLGAELISSRTLVEILTEIIFQAGAVMSPQNNMPEYIKTAVTDIDNHFKEDITLDYFAKKLSVSKFHLIKEFKRYTGFTPNEYLINARLNYARSMLMNSTLSISEICERCGFKNTSHFINTFKTKTGSTPLQFRKQTFLDPK